MAVHQDCTFLYTDLGLRFKGLGFNGTILKK